jgi:hypothetical protein
MAHRRKLNLLILPGVWGASRYSSHMGERGGVQHYLYWSDQRIRRFLDDQGIAVSERTENKLSSPTFSGFAPTLQTVWEKHVPYKVEIAKKVEGTLGRLAVNDFDSPAPIRFARGIWTVIFGEFVEPFGDENDVSQGYPRRALMYAYCVTRSKLRVGVCLFGSVHNYADYVKDAEGHMEDGWTSSAAPAVLRFLHGRCSEGDEFHSREDLAREVLKITDSQGMRKADNGTAHRGWNRAFTSAMHVTKPSG